MSMLAGDTGIKMSRKPEIMGDAAFAILTRNSREYTGHFLVDEDILREQGETNLDQYAHCPGWQCSCLT